MRYGRGKLYMPHALATDLARGDLHAALIANNAFVAYALIFAAIAFPILGRSENTLGKQSVLFGLLRAVIYGFGLGDFAVRPLADLIGTRQLDLHGIEIV